MYRKMLTCVSVTDASFVKALAFDIAIEVARITTA